MISHLTFDGSIQPMAIAQLVDKINTAEETTLGICLDFSKNFDTTDHKILFHMLEHYAFCGVILEWFKNYCSDRTPYVS